MKNLQKEILQTVKVLVLAVILTVGMNYAFATVWTPPTSAPPSGNVDGPVNVGSTGQTKSGGLTVGTGNPAIGFSVAAGNVGIGTTNPASKLNVTGTSLAGTASQSNISSFIGNGLRIGGSINGSSQDAVTYNGASGGGAAVAFGRGTSYDTFLSFYTNVVSNQSVGGMLERMRLDSNGNLGIGTISPTQRLDVNGNISLHGPGILLDSTGTTGAAGQVLTSRGSTLGAQWAPVSGGGGGVGPGTANRLAKFNSNGTTVGDSSITDNGTNVTFANPVCLSGDCRSAWGVSGQVNYVPKFNNGTSVGNSTIYQDSNANIGIGLTEANPPTQRLDVNGTIGVRGGSPAAGKVLTANDGNGAATWQAATIVYDQCVNRTVGAGNPFVCDSANPSGTKVMKDIMFDNINNAYVANCCRQRVVMQ